MSLTRNAWTTIAQRPRYVPEGRLTWSEVPNAELRLSDAHALAATGQLIMANRHTDEMVFLVVKQPAAAMGGNI